jgi:pimeloyl-ACP methyl ester carboxylesterase
MPNHHPIGISDVWVEHPHGRMFARVWSPAIDATRSAPRSPIVLFHDSLGCVDLWREFPAQLSASTGRRVIAYDRLGFGRSDPRSDKLTRDFIAAEAETFFPALLDRLGLRRFIAFGHSVGGSMAIHCAARYAADCDALVTESAQAFTEDKTLQGIREAQQQFNDQRQVDRLRKFHGEKAEWVLDAWIATWLSPDFAAWTLAPVLPQVTCPVLAMHGNDDEYGSTRHPEMIAQRCGGNGRMAIIADTRHVPHRERPQAIIDLVAGFVSSLD